jgi:hypothetical protein
MVCPITLSHAKKQSVVLTSYENGILAANAIMKIYLKWKFNINTLKVVD